MNMTHSYFAALGTKCERILADAIEEVGDMLVDDENVSDEDFVRILMGAVIFNAAVLVNTLKINPKAVHDMLTLAIQYSENNNAANDA